LAWVAQAVHSVELNAGESYTAFDLERDLDDSVGWALLLSAALARIQIRQLPSLQRALHMLRHRLMLFILMKLASW